MRTSGRHSNIGRLWPFILLGSAPDRARLRIRERLPRHRQCRGHRHLYPFPPGAGRGGLVGPVQLFGRAVLTGAVAFGILSLLPVELILQVGSRRLRHGVRPADRRDHLEFGTWWLGLPASSSHTLIGSIIGVGIMNAIMHGRDGTSGVDWGQATKFGEALLFSPLVGFTAPRCCCC